MYFKIWLNKLIKISEKKINFDVWLYLYNTYVEYIKKLLIKKLGN